MSIDVRSRYSIQPSNADESSIATIKKNSFGFNVATSSIGVPATRQQLRNASLSRRSNFFDLYVIGFSIKISFYLQ
jgi:hypothetical protein